MKKNLLYAFALICSLSFFTACSDDEDSSLPVEDINATYTSSNANNQLVLTYSGAVMLGKSATFNSVDGKTATITLTGAPISLTRADAQVGLINPGVIPGETTTTLTVNLIANGTNSYTFEGTDEVNSCTVVYKGSIEKGKLTIELTVTMPQNELIGTWNLLPYDAFGTAFPIRSHWESEQKFNVSIELVPGIPVKLDLHPGELIAMASDIGLIPTEDGKTLNLNEALIALLQNVTFCADGNIIASYSDAVNLASPIWANSPVNMVQYAVKNNRLYLYLNVDAVMGLITKESSTKGLDINTILPIVLPKLVELVPMLSQGIPLGYKIGEDGMLSVYIDKELGKPIIDTLILLMENDEVANAIKELATSNPDFGAFAGTVEAIIDQFPEVATKTNMETLELGLNFITPNE